MSPKEKKQTMDLEAVEEWNKRWKGRKGGRGTVMNVRLPRQGDRAAEWVGFDRHISHRLTAPSIAPGWSPWLTASRWRMNGVVRPTVSQSHIAEATRPLLNRHTAAQGDLWVYRQTLGTGGWSSSDHAKITYIAVATYNGHLDGDYFTLVGRSDTCTHGWFYSIYKKC